MTELSFVYKEDEFGWVTDSVELVCDIYLKVTLSESGYVVVKQKDEETGRMVKVLASSHCDGAEVLIRKGMGRTIKVLTSTEPISIRYEYIS